VKGRTKTTKTSSDVEGQSVGMTMTNRSDTATQHPATGSDVTLSSSNVTSLSFLPRDTAFYFQVAVVVVGVAGAAANSLILYAMVVSSLLVGWLGSGPGPRGSVTVRSTG